MSVLIKGMEMPTNCGECELCACYVFEDGTEEYYRCTITMYPIHNFDERHERCPLIPVHDHGRLIDADHLKQELRTSGIIDTYGAQVLLKIDNAPTIIPADKECDEDG